MSYKIECPVPNDILKDRALSGYIEAILKYKQNIDCLYLPLGHIMDNVDLWGIRAPNFVYDNQGKINKELLHRWEWCLGEVLQYVDLPVKVLMNNMYSASFHDSAASHIIKKKIEFYANKYNIKSVTIADYSAIGILNEVGLPISLSTNSHNSFAELDMALEIYGQGQFESIVVQRDLNRNPQKLMSYLNSRELVDKAVLMVNEGCINACPYKLAGDIEIGLSDIKTKNNVIHGGGCTILQNGHRWTFLTSPFLTHGMLSEYYPGIKRVKIAGRDLPVSNIKHQLKHWSTGDDVELEKILNVFPKDTGLKVSDLEKHETYLKDVMSCNKECFLCRKCETTYGKLTGTVHMKDSLVGKVDGFQIIDGSKILESVQP